MTTPEHVPLQITKALLKPWEPCADSYRWFLEKFPQGAEFTAVQKALREERRYTNVRWLSEKVWANLVLASPKTVANVTADHDAETVEIIAATKRDVAAMPKAAGADLLNDAGAPDAQLGSSGDGAQIGSSGNGAQLGSSGDGARIGSSGYGAQLGSSGDGAQLGSSGNGARIGSSGYGARIGSSGYGARIGSSGHCARINASGENTVIACAGLGNTAKSGVNGVMALAWFDDLSKRTRIAVGYVGEDLKAECWYRLDGGAFVEVAE